MELKPILSAGIEVLPIEPSVKDILDKVLEQNKMILEQNAKIIAVLSHPMFVIAPVTSSIGCIP